MDIATIAVTTAFTAVITGTVQTLIGLSFTKLVERQEKKLDGLSARVQLLEDQKIGAIEQRLRDGSEEFDDLHAENKNNIHRGDYLLHQETCASRFAALTADQKALERQFGEIRESTSATRAIVELIAGRLSISLPPVKKG